jgi:hypothetical protein
MVGVPPPEEEMLNASIVQSPRALPRIEIVIL